MKYTKIIARQMIEIEGTKKPDDRDLKALGAFDEQTISADENTVFQIVLNYIDRNQFGSLWTFTVE